MRYFLLILISCFAFALFAADPWAVLDALPAQSSPVQVLLQAQDRIVAAAGISADQAQGKVVLELDRKVAIILT